MNNINQPQIIKNAQAGDPKAMEQIVTNYNDKIFRLIFFRLNNWNDAQDLTQETFIKAFRNITKLKQADKFKPWLFSIAINLIKDFYRKKKLLSFFGRATDLETLIEYNCLSDNKSNIETAQEFQEEVTKKYTQSLSKNEKQVFLLKYIDDLTIPEIAQALNKNENTVKTHLYRSIAKIRKHRGVGI